MKVIIFCKIVWAEAVKQHRNYFHQKTIYLSLFLWPLLSFITAYYGYKAFDISASSVSYLTEENILVYLMLGYMCMSFFRSLVQSAWQFSFERDGGTLELIYLSPANRMAVLLGNALSSVFESVAVMFLFGLVVLFIQREQLRIRLLACLTVFLLLIVMSVLWGVMLNAMFLYSRDTSFLFTVLEEPMEIFSGVKVPFSLFPPWAQAIGAIFPLTYVLEAARQVVLGQASFQTLYPFFRVSFCIILLLFSVTLITIRVVERHLRVTGTVTLF